MPTQDKEPESKAPGRLKVTFPVLYRCPGCRSSLVVRTGDSLMVHGPNSTITIEDGVVSVKNVCPKCRKAFRVKDVQKIISEK